MQQLRGRYSCDPESNTCCVPTEPSSVLATRLGIHGLVPLTEASCTDQPGCMSQQYCYPSWALDSCRAFTTSAACLDAEQCQVGRARVEGWADWFGSCRVLVYSTYVAPAHPTNAFTLLQWYGNKQWGSCVDATLLAKCRLAGAASIDTCWEDS